MWSSTCSRTPASFLPTGGYRPGGHWNDAYPFVTLHQPAAFYGAPSAQLGDGGSDLASRARILAYYEGRMKRFLDSGRVEFLPLTDYRGQGRLVSTLDADRAIDVTVRERIVDATCMNVEVPATRGPSYSVDSAVTVVPPNTLAGIREPWERYVVIGGGKTGIDAMLFLLDRGVAHERIHWIVPNDSWLWHRAAVQPHNIGEEMLRQVQAAISAGSIDEMFQSLERQSSVMRLDQSALPTKWRCATVNRQEFDALRRITNVIRMGRVTRVTSSTIELEQGNLSTDAHTLHVDCTANGLAKLAPRPIFAPGEIALQSVFMCQQVFSAALAARVALLDVDDDERNRMLRVVPHPEHVEDLPGCLAGSMENLLRVTPHCPWWLYRCRLNGMSHASFWRYLAIAWRAWRLRAAAARAAERLAAAQRHHLSQNTLTSA